MPTIINNPPDSGGGNSGGVGLVVGVVVVIAIIGLFFIYGLPAMRQNNSSGTTINVPDKIQVDVNKE